MLGSSADHWLSTITALGVRPCFLTASSDARMVHDAPSVICEELPGGDLAPWRLEHRLQFGKRLRRGIRSHAVVVIVEFAVAGERGFDLAPEKTLRLRIGKPLVTFGGVGVRLRARDAEEMADHFRRLSHVELGDRIGQSALQPNNRLEIGGAHFCERREFGQNSLGAGKPGKPAHALLRPHQRRVTERFRAAGEDQVGNALADIAVASVDRLHAGAAIDLHGECHHRFSHAEPQCGDTRRVHLVGDHVDAAEDHLIEGIAREWLPGQ